MSLFPLNNFPDDRDEDEKAFDQILAMSTTKRGVTTQQERSGAIKVVSQKR